MKLKYFFILAIMVAVVACEKGTKDHPIILDDMEFSELTLSQLPYQTVDSVIFSDSVGNKIVGLIFKDSLRDQPMNIHYYNELFYSTRYQTQAIVLTFVEINVTYNINFQTKYLSPETNEYLDDLLITSKDPKNNWAGGVLMKVTDRKNTSDELIDLWYKGKAISVQDFALGNVEYYDVFQGALNPELPIHFFYNTEFGILSFRDHEGTRWDLHQ